MRTHKVPVRTVEADEVDPDPFCTCGVAKSDHFEGSPYTDGHAFAPDSDEREPLPDPPEHPSNVENPFPPSMGDRDEFHAWSTGRHLGKHFASLVIEAAVDGIDDTWRKGYNAGGCNAIHRVKELLYPYANIAVDPKGNRLFLICHYAFEQEYSAHYYTLRGEREGKGESQG